MNKKTYILKIKDETIETNISLKKTNESAMRYVKMFLSRTNQLEKTIKYLKEKNNYDETFCPFCGKTSAHNLIYKIEDNIFVLDIAPKMKNNKRDLYCYSGINCPGGRLNPNSIAFISQSLSVDEDTAKHIIHERNASPFYAENHKDKDAYKKSQSRDIEWYISKYGKMRGTELFFERNKKMSEVTSKEYMIKKHGLEFVDEITKKKAINRLSHWVNKYGEERGAILFADYKQKIFPSGRTSLYSNESINAFELLLKSIDAEDIRMKENELRLYDKKVHKLYAYDLFFIHKNRKVIIEYDTPFMHPNPEYMNNEELANWVNVFTGEKNWEDKYNIDIQKRKFAELQGYLVIVIYVTETYTLEENIEKIKKILC